MNTLRYTDTLLSREGVLKDFLNCSWQFLVILYAEDGSLKSEIRSKHYANPHRVDRGLAVSTLPTQHHITE